MKQRASVHEGVPRKWIARVTVDNAPRDRGRYAVLR